MKQASGAVRLSATLGAALTTLCLAFTAAANSLQRLEPQPSADELQQGLSVVYHFNFFRHVREIEVRDLEGETGHGGSSWGGA